MKKTKRVKLIDVIPDDELHLLVFMSRRTIHEFFTDPKVKAKYPLVVKIPDPKSGKDRLLNLSTREEFYGRVKAKVS